MRHDALNQCDQQTDSLHGICVWIDAANGDFFADRPEQLLRMLDIANAVYVRVLPLIGALQFREFLLPCTHKPL